MNKITVCYSDCDASSNYRNNFLRHSCLGTSSAASIFTLTGIISDVNQDIIIDNIKQLNYVVDTIKNTANIDTTFILAYNLELPPKQVKMEPHQPWYALPLMAISESEFGSEQIWHTT